MTPVIGISGRRWASTKLAVEPRYQTGTFDMHFSDYPSRVAAAGGLPIHLPYESAEGVVDILDGLIITGGQDVHPSLWGADPAPHPHDYDVDRDTYEITLITAAISAGVPVVAVCRGMQVLNVARGGTLIADLDTADIDHQQRGHDVDAETHTVEFAAESQAFAIYGASASVNSLHHQAVDTPGHGLVVTGRAPDGVIEAIEIPGAAVLGVQWHPEWRTADPIFGWLVERARTDRNGRRGAA